jgi:hypothetical protein
MGLSIWRAWFSVPAGYGHSGTSGRSCSIFVAPVVRCLLPGPCGCYRPDAVVSARMWIRCSLRRVHFLGASADVSPSPAEGVSPFAAMCIGIINHGKDTRAWTQLLGAVHVGSSCYWDGIEPRSVASRRALLIGVNSYDVSNNLTPLSKCIDDAQSVGGMLEPLGYEVTYSLDPTREEFVCALESFSKSLARTGLAIVHFSGHGFAPTRENFLSAKDSKCTFHPDDQKIASWAARLPLVVVHVISCSFRASNVD